MSERLEPVELVFKLEIPESEHGRYSAAVIAAVTYATTIARALNRSVATAPEDSVLWVNVGAATVPLVFMGTEWGISPKVSVCFDDGPRIEIELIRQPSAPSVEV